MACRGHWLFNLLREIPTISEGSAKTYWYQISKGLDEEERPDPVMIRKGILACSTPPAGALRVKTFLDHYPDYGTPALWEVVLDKYKAKEPANRHTKPIPTLAEIEEMYAEADSKLVPGAEFPFVAWVALALALRQHPLRVAELASVRVNDPEAPNNYDTETDTLTLAVHKNAKAKGTRKHHVPGFGEAWTRRAEVVFGDVPDYLVGREMKPKALSSFLTRRGIGSQTLRPAITTALMKSMSFDERGALAERMGHSRGVQASVYRRD